MKEKCWKKGAKSRANNLSEGVNISLTVAWTLLVLRAAPTMDDYNVFTVTTQTLVTLREERMCVCVQGYMCVKAVN